MSAFQNDLQLLLPDLIRFARMLTRNENDAHDLVQDCVERALRKQALFQAGTSLKSWTFTLMRNIFISQRRRIALDRRYVAGRTRQPGSQGPAFALAQDHGLGLTDNPFGNNVVDIFALLPIDQRDVPARGERRQVDGRGVAQ